MAHRRMISQEIVDTDLFAEMSQSARYLYYELLVRADDDGFIGSPMRIARMVECDAANLEELITNKYVIRFKSGIVVIRDWKIHNSIRKDIYKKTLYQDEFSLLREHEKRYYLDDESNVTYSVTDNVTYSVTLGKDSKDKISKDNTHCASVPDDTKKAPDKTKKEASELFEKVWALYPSKKGKGQVSDTQKKKLLKIGEEELTRAIERYKADLARDEWRKPQNGSTFFNSGYVDYLDENWQPGADSSEADDDAAAWEKFRSELDEQYSCLRNVELDPELFPNG